MKELIDEKNDLVGALDLFEIDMKEQLVQPTIVSMINAIYKEKK